MAGRDAAPNAGAEGSPTGRSDDVVAGRRADTPLDFRREVLRDVAWGIQRDMVRNQTTLLAAGIAFRAFLALFPVVIVAVTATALVRPGEEIVFQARRLMAGLPARGREVIISQVELIADSDQTALRIAFAVSVVLAVWTAASALQGTITALTSTHREVDERSWVAQRILALKFAAASVPFVIVSVSLIGGVPWILQQAGLGSFAQVLGVIATLVILSMMMASALTILYRFGPHRRTPKMRWASPGAVVATVLWVAGSEVLKLVTENFRDYDARYGVAAGVVILMLWLWLTAYCVLLGSTLNARLEHQTLVDSTVGPRQPVGQRRAVPADTHPDRPMPDGTPGPDRPAPTPSVPAEVEPLPPGGRA